MDGPTGTRRPLLRFGEAGAVPWPEAAAAGGATRPNSPTRVLSIYYPATWSIDRLHTPSRSRRQAITTDHIKILMASLAVVGVAGFVETGEAAVLRAWSLTAMPMVIPRNSGNLTTRSRLRQTSKLAVAVVAVEVAAEDVGEVTSAAVAGEGVGVAVAGEALLLPLRGLDSRIRRKEAYVILP